MAKCGIEDGIVPSGYMCIDGSSGYLAEDSFVETFAGILVGRVGEL